MDNGQIYDFCNTILRKEREGSALTPERFTLMLLECMWEKCNADYKQWELDQIVTDSLRSLKTEESIAIDASGISDITLLTDDYWHPSSITYTDPSPFKRKIDIVTSDEYSDLITNSLLLPTLEYPIAKIVGDNIVFYPLVSTTATFSFLKTPPEPFFDYYIDANDEIIYLQEGQVYTLQADETYTEKESPFATLIAGQSIGVKPTNNANNLSKELFFHDDDRIDVIYKILQKFGITLREMEAAQYGIAREDKEETV